MGLTFLGDFIVFLAGGALVWFFRARIEQAVVGINAISKKIHALLHKS